MAFIENVARTILYINKKENRLVTVFVKDG